MSRPIAKPTENRATLIGRRVRIRAEGEVLAHYEPGPTAPERISVRIDGIITIVPIARVEVMP